MYICACMYIFLMSNKLHIVKLFLLFLFSLCNYKNLIMIFILKFYLFLLFYVYTKTEKGLLNEKETWLREKDFLIKKNTEEKKDIQEACELVLKKNLEVFC